MKIGGLFKSAEFINSQMAKLQTEKEDQLKTEA
jgi:hypothetical protein